MRASSRVISVSPKSAEKMAAPLRLLEGREGGEPRGTGFRTQSIHKGTRFIRQIRLRNTRVRVRGTHRRGPNQRSADFGRGCLRGPRHGQRGTTRRTTRVVAERMTSGRIRSSYLLRMTRVSFGYVP
ncbi:hypothetical protein ACOMHN_065262 [Nucella lapillus]